MFEAFNHKGEGEASSQGGTWTLDRAVGRGTRWPPLPANACARKGLLYSFCITGRKTIPMIMQTNIHAWSLSWTTAILCGNNRLSANFWRRPSRQLQSQRRPSPPERYCVRKRQRLHLRKVVVARRTLVKAKRFLARQTHSPADSSSSVNQPSTCTLFGDLSVVGPAITTRCARK